MDPKRGGWTLGEMGTVLGCIGLVVLALLIGGWLLEYTVETWAEFFGKTADVPMPHVLTIIAGAILSEILLPIAAVTWLLSFVVL